MSKPKKNSSIVDLTEGPLVKQLIFFALPIMGGNLLQALYTLVDLWVVGKFASAVAISAVTVSSQIVFLMHAVGIGLGSGGQVLIAQQVGAKDSRRLNTTIGTLLTTCALSSIVFAAIGAGGTKLWLSIMQTPAEAMSDAVSYLLICCIGVPFVYGGGTLCAILRGAGDSKTPMYILGVSAGVNVVLDLLFVAKFDMGAAGAAWATVIAQVISLVYGVIVFVRNQEGLGFDGKKESYRIDMPTFKAIWKLSAPLVVMTAAINISMMVITAFVNTYGVAASAITGIGNKLGQLITVVSGSMQTAVGSMVAQNFAAGKIDRVRSVNRVSNLVCAVFFVIILVLSLLFPEQIIGFFTQASDTDVIALARPFMHAECCLFFGFCFMAGPLGHINGVGYTTLNLIISVLDGVIGRIGLAVLLGMVFHLGVVGFWWGHALASLISVILGWAYYLSGRWEKRELILH